MRDRPETTTHTRSKDMSQNIVQVAGTDNEEKITERLVEQLHRHADSFGV